ncbi:acetate/propionate family kinase [Methylomicrobium album]|uniref:Acetate kinase n=1 Tax=Methylomicrobium album BG8 TaxID=686340 RepID=H8GK78_METAL|nr:acetate/propionate family kinase [Methylomicrobium album]EIC29202.1 acetate kinase [Methylomicrobium album BG8]
MRSDEFMLLIINVGSATVKTRLFDSSLREIARMNADYGNGGGIRLNGWDSRGKDIERHIPENAMARQALSAVFDEWREQLPDLQAPLGAIGHRVVHGGGDFTCATRMTSEVSARLAELDAYAPLHNPLNRLGVSMAEAAFPGIPQYAVFDTAFHRQMPEHASRYPIPPALSGNVEFRRFGFHGISCQYSVTRAATLLSKDRANINCIILHLGGGASATAVLGGRGVDTSMGFSPTEGLMMTTRSGDIDPMIPVTLLREGWTADRLDRLLNRESGLLGVCGAGDMREVLRLAENGDQRARLAVDIYCYRIRKYIGALCAVLGDVDALIFTGGIGEHAPLIRQKIAEGLDRLGFAIDVEANLRVSEHDRDIGSPIKKPRILVIHAEEEREIAAQILNRLEYRS